ncbi:MAG: OmpA family protein [Pseudomonadota bacterium]
MRIRTYLPMAIAIVSAAALSIFSATVAVEKIETGARVGILRALNDEQIGWARVRVSGLQVRLSGTAPDEASRFKALAAAGTVVDATRIIDHIGITPAAAVEAPEFKVEVLRNLDGISLIGLIPAQYDRAEMLDRIGRIANTPVTDLLEEGRYPVPNGWEPAVAFALDALDTVPRSKVTITADQVSITGIVDSEQQRRQVENALTQDAPRGLDLRLDISAPRPVIAPFTLRFVIEEERRRFDACAAETSQARDRIVAAAVRLGVQQTNGCRIGLGSPSVAWAEAVITGMDMLDGLGEGSVTYSDADVSLVVPHTVTASAFDRAVGQLERRLPAGFSLTAVRQPPPEDDLERQGPNGIPEFVAIRDDEGKVELTGRIGSERTRRAVESYAYSHFGRETTEAATRLDATLPQGWSMRAFASLDALSYLAKGSVRMRPDSLEIAGETGQEDAAAEIARILSERLGTGAQYKIDVRYVERLDPALNIPTPETCVKDLNTVLSVQKLSFEPGSATLDGPSLEVIDKLAEILKACQDVPIEIGAHSDSQGRESMNLRLSQERADAVLNAILARRVLTANLEAVGYGETVPIADNGTEEGREANRRIEFTLIGEDEEVAEADDAAPEGDEE